jgi:hypothetical protein
LSGYFIDCKLHFLACFLIFLDVEVILLLMGEMSKQLLSIGL